jgi:hypothetical protein
MAGGNARPLDATVRPGRRGGCSGRLGWRLVGAGATVRAGAGLGDSARTTVCRWGQRAVVTRGFLIGPFEFEFDNLNLKLVVFYYYDSKNPNKIPKYFKFLPHPINTPI